MNHSWKSAPSLRMHSFYVNLEGIVSCSPGVWVTRAAHAHQPWLPCPAYTQAPVDPRHGPAGHQAAAGASSDPKLYYEPVPPSSWKPDQNDDFLDLYRRCICLCVPALCLPVLPWLDVCCMYASRWRCMPVCACPVPASSPVTWCMLHVCKQVEVGSAAGMMPPVLLMCWWAGGSRAPLLGLMSHDTNGGVGAWLSALSCTKVYGVHWMNWDACAPH